MTCKELPKTAKPILFNTKMVRAILKDRKTVMRRVIKPQPPSKTHPQLFVTPPYRPGDILYVRESWDICECEKCRAGIPSLGGDCTCEYVYRADYIKLEDDILSSSMFRFHPAIFMPKEATRIFLRVTDVWIEQLQEITQIEAVKEGFINDTDLNFGTGASARRHFFEHWDSNIKKSNLHLYGWDANPWVWVIKFKRISKEEAENED